MRWLVVIYIIMAYASLSTVFTPVIALIVHQGLRKKAGLSMSFFNLGCILASNILLYMIVTGFKLPISLLWYTLIGEVILWIILTKIIKKQVIYRFKDDFYFFYPYFNSKMKNFLLQPLFFFNRIDDENAAFLKLLFIPLVFCFSLFFWRTHTIVVAVDDTAIKSNCAIIMPDMEISIKSISNNEITYTNNKEKKWTFPIKGDGLYVPEGEYLFLCDFYKGDYKNETILTYSRNDIKIIANIKKGKVYYLKHNLEIVENNRFRVSLFIEEG
jgi:hypothetical protein